MTTPMPTPDDTFIMVPVDLIGMVADGKISKNAALLYVILLSFVNHKRNDWVVWPSRELLAERMGLSRPASVDAPMAELKATGLVTAVEQRIGSMRSKNLYTLHLVCSPRSTENRIASPPAETSNDAGRSAVRKTGQRSTENRTPVVRKTEHELDLGLELDLEDQNLLSPREPDELSAGAALEDERDASVSQDSKPADPYAMQRGHLQSCGVIDPTELDVFPALIEELNAVKKPRAWWQHAAGNGTLPACVDEARETLTSSGMFSPRSGEVDRATFARSLHDMPKCEHGTRGGHVPYPPTGWVACAIERNQGGYRPYSDRGRNYYEGEL